MASLGGEGSVGGGDRVKAKWGGQETVDSLGLEEGDVVVEEVGV